jgi:hypothetical protein
MCRGGWYEAGDNKPTDLGTVGQNLIVRSNILTHFIKEKFFINPYGDYYEHFKRSGIS